MTSIPRAAGDDEPAAAVLRSILAGRWMPGPAHVASALPAGDLDRKARAMVVVAAVIATGGCAISYRRCVDEAIAAGASAEEIVDVLVAVAPTIGLAHLAPATNELAAALGYDVDRALEVLEAPTPPPPA